MSFTSETTPHRQETLSIHSDEDINDEEYEDVDEEEEEDEYEGEEDEEEEEFTHHTKKRAKTTNSTSSPPTRAASTTKPTQTTTTTTTTKTASTLQMESEAATGIAHFKWPYETVGNMAWCTLSKVALLEAANLTLRVSTFNDCVARWELESVIDIDSKRDLQIAHFLRCLLRFDDSYVDIRSKHQSINDSRVRNQRSSIRGSSVYTWKRPKSPEKRAVEREKISKTKKGDSNILLYDKLCEMDDITLEGVSMMDSMETMEDVVAREANKRKRQAEATDTTKKKNTSAKLAVTLQRREAAAKAKLKAAAATEDAAASIVERNTKSTELQEAHAKVTGAQLAKSVVAQERTAVAQERSAVAFERTADALSELSGQLGRFFDMLQSEWVSKRSSTDE